MSAFFIDESHLHWNEACGYGGDAKTNGLRSPLKMVSNAQPIMGPWMWSRAPSLCRATPRRMHSIRSIFYAIYNRVVPGNDY